MREDSAQSDSVRLHGAVSSALRKRRVCLITSAIIIATHLVLVLVANAHLKPMLVLACGMWFFAPIVGFPIFWLYHKALVEVEEQANHKFQRQSNVGALTILFILIVISAAGGVVNDKVRESQLSIPVTGVVDSVSHSRGNTSCYGHWQGLARINTYTGYVPCPRTSGDPTGHSTSFTVAVLHPDVVTSPPNTSIAPWIFLVAMPILFMWAWRRVDSYRLRKLRALLGSTLHRGSSLSS